MRALLFVLFLHQAHAAVVLSETIGSVDDEYYTSRQARLSGLMDRLLQNETVEDRSEDAVARQRSALLLEAALNAEAKSFNLDAATREQKLRLIDKTNDSLNAHPDAKKDAFSANEIASMASMKLIAKELIRLKSSSLKGETSDAEAQDYFEKNRAKFGSLPFDSFKQNIKNFLAKRELEDRLRSWYELVKHKHKFHPVNASDLAPAK